MRLRTPMLVIFLPVFALCLILTSGVTTSASSGGRLHVVKPVLFWSVHRIAPSALFCQGVSRTSTWMTRHCPSLCNYPFSVSIPLAAARRHLGWFEHACDTVGHFLLASSHSPVSLRASPRALACLEPVAGWPVECVFIRQANGLGLPV